MMVRAATRGGKPQDFNYPARARQRQLGNEAYGKLWPIVDGAVADALKSHPDYLTPKGQRSARTSIVKRVTGTVIGFAEQSAKGRVAPAEKEDGPVLVAPQATAPLDAEAEAGVPTPRPHHPFNCRIGKVTLKPRRDPIGRFANADTPSAATIRERRASIAGQLAVYNALTTPEQRSLETQSYIARKRAEAIGGRG